MSFNAGQRISARCTKCKDITGHIVIVVVDEMPVKVECCACKSVHKYYPVEGKKAKKVENHGPVRVSASQNRETEVKKASKKISTEKLASTFTTSSVTPKKKNVTSNNTGELWLKAMDNTLMTPKDYTIDIVLSENDIIQHSVFGLGMVQEVLGSDKVSVLFQDAVRTLKCKLA